MSQLASRLFDVALEDGGLRGPLSGLFPPDLRVPSLADAMRSVCAMYPKLDPEQGQMVEIAREKADEIREGFPSMLIDFLMIH